MYGRSYSNNNCQFTSYSNYWNNNVNSIVTFSVIIYRLCTSICQDHLWAETQVTTRVGEMHLMRQKIHSIYRLTLRRSANWTSGVCVEITEVQEICKITSVGIFWLSVPSIGTCWDILIIWNRYFVVVLVGLCHCSQFSFCPLTVLVH